MNWYNANQLCNKCKGCEVVADGEAVCFCEIEEIYEEDY